MHKVIPRMETFLVYEAQARAAGRRPSYCLNAIVSKQLPEDTTYVEEASSPQWHRDMRERVPGSVAYALYNLAVIELEERIACLK